LALAGGEAEQETPSRVNYWCGEHSGQDHERTSPDPDDVGPDSGCNAYDHYSNAQKPTATLNTTSTSSAK